MKKIKYVHKHSKGKLGRTHCIYTIDRHSRIITTAYCNPEDVWSNRQGRIESLKKMNELCKSNLFGPMKTNKGIIDFLNKVVFNENRIGN